MSTEYLPDISSTTIDLNDDIPVASSSTSSNIYSLPSLAAGLDSNTSMSSFLNGILPSSSATPNLSELDKTLNELLTQFTLLSQDTSSALELSISDISRTVPRLTYDLQFMRESALALQGELGMVQSRMRRQKVDKVGSGSKNITANGDSGPSKDKIANITEERNGIEEDDHEKTNKSLDKLTHLDKLKSRMESARDILREAESWSTLESEIQSFISSSEWEKAGNRISEASRSMIVFQSTPAEYQSRSTLLNSLLNELETALAAVLRSSIEKEEVDEIAKFHVVFDTIGRNEEFKNYYFTERRKKLVDEWVEWDDDRVNENGTRNGDGKGDGFSKWLPSFYASLLRLLEKERDQMFRIFPFDQAPHTLSSFLSSILDSLTPSLQNRLDTMVDSLGNSALPDVIKCYRSTEELVLTIHSVIQQMQSHPPTPSSPSLPPLSPSLRTPRTPLTPNRPLPQKRGSSIHFPKTPKGGYFGLDAPSSNANGLLSVSTAAPPQVSAAWEHTLFESFVDLQTNYGTLESNFLLHLLRTDHTLHSTKSDVSSLMEKSILVFKLAEDAIARCMAFTHGYGSLGLLSAISEFLAGFFNQSHGVLERTTPKSEEVNDELDFGMDYSTEDWASFQSDLNVLKAIKEISTKLTNFQTKLYPFLEQALEIPQPNVTPVGAVDILKQSSLNSTELQQLLASLSPPSIPLPTVEKALRDLISASQQSLQDTILAPLRQSLSGYPALNVWTSQEKSRKDGLSIPTFSLSPTDIMARVSEGLLNLLRVFEVYSKDDTLAFSLETLPFIDKSQLDSVLQSSSSPDPRQTSISVKSTTITLPPEIILSTWISSLALTLLSHLTKSILPSIPRLTQPGANQLASDLSYLSNAVRALDVEWEDLERWKKGSEVDEDEWREILTSIKGVDREEREAREVWMKIGRTRGWMS